MREPARSSRGGRIQEFKLAEILILDSVGNGGPQAIAQTLDPMLAVPCSPAAFVGGGCITKPSARYGDLTARPFTQTPFKATCGAR